jgi:hypothetical protein
VDRPLSVDVGSGKKRARSWQMDGRGERTAMSQENTPSPHIFYGWLDRAGQVQCLLTLAMSDPNPVVELVDTPEGSGVG